VHAIGLAEQGEVHVIVDHEQDAGVLGHEAQAPR
jgi:hypothetical protein